MHSVVLEDVRTPTVSGTVLVTCEAADGQEPHVVVATLPASVLDELVQHAQTVKTVQGLGLDHVVREIEALVQQADAPRPMPSHRERMLAQAKEFIDQQLDDEELTPDRIARGIFVSTRYLHILFRAEGRSVTRYLITRRLSVTLRRLRDPQLSHQSIAEIALRAGFKDASHYARVFKAEYGVTPSQYRTQPLRVVHGTPDRPAAA